MINSDRITEIKYDVRLFVPFLKDHNNAVKHRQRGKEKENKKK